MNKKLTNYQIRKLTDYALENYETYLNPSEMKKTLREMMDIMAVLNEERPSVLSFQGPEGAAEEIVLEPIQQSGAEFETQGEKNRGGFFSSLLGFIGRCFLYFAILGCAPSLRKTVRFGDPIALFGLRSQKKTSVLEASSRIRLVHPYWCPERFSAQEQEVKKRYRHFS